MFYTLVFPAEPEVPGSKPEVYPEAHGFYLQMVLQMVALCPPLVPAPVHFVFAFVPDANRKHTGSHTGKKAVSR